MLLVLGNLPVLLVVNGISDIADREYDDLLVLPQAFRERDLAVYINFLLIRADRLLGKWVAVVAQAEFGVVHYSALELADLGPLLAQRQALLLPLDVLLHFLDFVYQVDLRDIVDVVQLLHRDLLYPGLHFGLGEKEPLFLRCLVQKFDLKRA